MDIIAFHMSEPSPWATLMKHIQYQSTNHTTHIQTQTASSNSGLAPRLFTHTKIWICCPDYIRLVEGHCNWISVHHCVWVCTNDTVTVSLCCIFCYGGVGVIRKCFWICCAQRCLCFVMLGSSLKNSSGRRVTSHYDRMWLRDLYDSQRDCVCVHLVFFRGWISFIIAYML